MPLDVASFKAEFPEFAHARPELVQAKLADARGSVHEAAFGERYEQYVKYMTAELLGATPAGEFARLKKPDEDGSITIYGRRARQLARAVLGPMVL